MKKEKSSTAKATLNIMYLEVNGVTFGIFIVPDEMKGCEVKTIELPIQSATKEVIVVVEKVVVIADDVPLMSEQIHAATEEDATEPAKEFGDYLDAKPENDAEPILLADIMYIDGNKPYCDVHLSTGKVPYVKCSLVALMNLLPPEKFCVIKENCIAGIAFVEFIDKGQTGFVRFKDKNKREFSKRKASEIRKLFKIELKRRADLLPPKMRKRTRMGH